MLPRYLILQISLSFFQTVSFLNQHSGNGGNNLLYHLFIIKLTKNNKNIHRKLFIFLRKNKIFLNLHYLPVHLHPFYRKMGFKKGNFPASENYSESAISIPIFPDLKLQNQKKVISLLKKFFK